MRFESKHYLGNIMIPALIIGGKKDRLVKAEASEFMRSQMKNADLQLMKYGHLDLVEDPNNLNKVLDSFISAVYKDDSAES